MSDRARAILNETPHEDDCPAKRSMGYCDCWSERALRAIDKALEAAGVPREPTEAMAHEGGYEVSDPTDECRDEDEARARKVWRAMYDAALTKAD